MLRADQSSNQRALHDVNQFTGTLTPLLHWRKGISSGPKKDNADRSLCEETRKMVVILLVIYAAMLMLRWAATIWG
ncbi:hypothetical protein CIT292_07434 [Citrobacter youngae ATCC 29220]|uniref:Uncharacterized protein n=1 Tax=Citrobacter youngae ATCC 29220 TaxID=500640 RepID=D4BAE0_9ENTR|nr:hypothetical protein CIT292_07434 [Citrobacter youngae ATCC 29220]